MSGLRAHRDRVAVVGAGVGGLVSALLLAAKGFEVHVYERAAGPGGKMREVPVGDARLDGGPTVFTMRWVFDELFDEAGLDFSSLVPVRPLDLLARHGWPDGSAFDLHRDIDATCDAIDRVFGGDDAKGYRDFCARAARIYTTLEGAFLRGSRPAPWSLPGRVGWTRIGDLMSIAPFATLSQALAQHFRDPRLQQLFGRYATYCGSSPYLSPATLMLVAHVERVGVWSIDGGMHRLAQALVRAAEAKGARFHWNAHVESIEQQRGRVCGVVLDGGERVEADAVVFNGDAAALATGRLGDGVQRAVERHVANAPKSLSAVVWNLVATTQGFPLQRHNVFFSSRYAPEFDDILQRRRTPREPTVYVCALDRDDDNAAPPAGGERLLCLVNAPALADGEAFHPEELASCEERMIRQLHRCGLRLDFDARRAVCTTPADFGRMFPATGGALYGQAGHGWRSAFTRPASRSRIRGLYLAGGSTHPGPGVPMAALSARLAVRSLLEDRASTARWSPAATPGGMPTR